VVAIREHEGDVRLSGLPEQVLYGVAYYAEYQPYDRLERDLDLMAEAGLTVIRVGESVWSTWEPEDGRFELEWLAPVLDGAHERGIKVILGTPTYAMPPWLVRKYPEVTAERRTGARIPYGHRQDGDYSHAAFRWHADRVARAVVGRYAQHPAIIGYQVDNEPGMELFHNRAAFEGFVDSLRAKYGNVATLNREWGLVYWSHRLARWDELWTADGNTVPSYDLAWRRYQSRITTDFIAAQAALVRELARPDQFVTTCMALSRPAFDPRELNQSLDVAAVNPYYAMQDALTLPEPPPDAPALGWTPHSGPWAIHFQGDLTYAALKQPFLVTETNALAIGASHQNFPAFDGQWRQAAWALVARGARMVEYWHWHSIHYGHEQYWLGVLNHDGEPGRCYEEVKRIASDFAAAGDAVVGLTPHADVGLLYSRESKWALEFHPPLATDTGAADRGSYERIFTRFYAGLFEAGVEAEILFAQEFETTAHPVLIAPALYVADDALLERLEAYAAGGGHLVLTFRGGYADGEARPRTTVQPGWLAEAVGATYDEYTNLTAPVRVSGDFSGAATAWADALRPTTAEALAHYEHPHLGRWPAITTNEHGKGRVTYVGTLPDRALAVALARWLRPDPDLFCDRPKTVTVTSGRGLEGERVRFVSNWSWEQTALAMPVAATDVVSGEPIASGEELHLGPWDVRVLLERPPEKEDEEGRPLA
jgi:beta-galactosidase